MRLTRVYGSRMLAIFTAFALFTVAVGSFSTANGTRRTVYDFTGDSRTDFVTLGSSGVLGSPLNWRFLRNPALPGPAFIRAFDFGVVGDTVTAAERFGDGKFDVSVWRSGVFYSAEFPESSAPLGPLTVVQWGQGGDNLGRDGDYDGDGKDDYTILRFIGNQLYWFYKTATPASDRATPFASLTDGFTAYAFQGVDFTGDTREEFVTAQEDASTGAIVWYIGDSITGALLHVVHWGNFNTGFLIQPDDYTGDGIADIAFWRAVDGSWWIRDTVTGATVPPVVFGVPDSNFVNNDLPVRGDYDGDNIADRAVFRRSTREFFWINSSNGGIGGQQWGNANDTPLANSFVF